MGGEKRSGRQDKYLKATRGDGIADGGSLFFLYRTGLWKKLLRGQSHQRHIAASANEKLTHKAKKSRNSKCMII